MEEKTIETIMTELPEGVQEIYIQDLGILLINANNERVNP